MANDDLVQRLSTICVAQFLRIHAAGVVLLLFNYSRLRLSLLSNSPWFHQFLAIWETFVGFQSGSTALVRSLQDWINDALMTFFFVALELKRELVRGELNNPRQAVLSIATAVGGMFVPALFYLAL